MSLERMAYDAATGTVINRSERHLGLKRNFPVMPGAEWLARLRKHIPDRDEHLVRYVGWYSNRARGERAKEASPHASAALPAPSEQPSTEFAVRAKAMWARLIRKVDEADSLECPKDKGPMRVIALIQYPPVSDASSIAWACGRRGRCNEVRHWVPAWPVHASLPLTYRPVLDIA